MEFDHLIPQAAGGTNREENLWLACRRCNAFKGTQTQARDPQSGERVALFNPRRQL
jgi:5-methylcytosine-specific restriction endonuclease McrA